MGGLDAHRFSPEPAWNRGASHGPPPFHQSPQLFPLGRSFLESGRFGDSGPVSLPCLLGSAPPPNPCGLRPIQSQPCPTPCLPWRGPQPPTSRPGLWGRERAEGLALHTNVLPIVKAPLCRRAPLRRLRGGHNGGSVPKFPPNSHLLSEPPRPTTPHTPQCPEGPERLGGVGPGLGGGKGRKSPPPPPGWGNGHLEGRGPAGRAGAACGWSWHAGSVQPAEGRRRDAACPLLAPRFLVPSSAWLCLSPSTHRRTHICRGTQAHTHLCSPTHGTGLGGWGGDVPRHSSCPRPTDLHARHHPLADAPAHPHPPLLSPCTPFTSLSQLSSTPPPLHALSGPCCSNTGYNKFALVVTLRMWPWGGECPAAPNPLAYSLTTDAASAEL